MGLHQLHQNTSKNLICSDKIRCYSEGFDMTCRRKGQLLSWLLKPPLEYSYGPFRELKSANSKTQIWLGGVWKRNPPHTNCLTKLQINKGQDWQWPRKGFEGAMMAIPSFLSRFSWGCRQRCPSTSSGSLKYRFHQYHPGRNYYKITPWNNCFCNIFVVFF